MSAKVTERKCYKCKVVKPLTSEFFYADQYRHKTGKGQPFSGKCKLCDNDRKKAWKKDNPEHVQEERLKRYYGITLDTYKKMLADQNGKCAICRTSVFGGRGKRPQTDHYHTTGKIRGLLCFDCNRGLGSFKDNTAFLQAAISYLEEPRNNTI